MRIFAKLSPKVERFQVKVELRSVKVECFRDKVEHLVVKVEHPPGKVESFTPKVEPGASIRRVTVESRTLAGKIRTLYLVSNSSPP